MGKKSNSSGPILVLGMHRSGTSVVTGVLRLLGVELGPDLMVPDQFNPRGYWEHNGIVRLHDRLLGELGSEWHDVRPLPEGWWHAPSIQPFRRELREILARDFADANLWAVKDPRLCRLLPLWHAVLADLKQDPRFVLVLRHPAEVVKSIDSRDGIPAAKTLLLWLQHLLQAEASTRGRPRAIVGMRDVMTDWKGEVRKVGRTLGLTWPRSVRAAADDVDAFLDPDLRHHVHVDETTTAQAPLPPWITQAWNLLTEQIDSRGTRHLAALTSIRRKLEEATALFTHGSANSAVRPFGPSVLKQEALIELRAEVAAGTETIEQLRADLTASRSAADELEQRVRAGADRIADLERNLSERERRLAEVDRESDDRAQAIRELQGELDAQTERVRESEGRSQEARETIQAMERQLAEERNVAGRLRRTVDELREQVRLLEQDRDALHAFEAEFDRAITSLTEKVQRIETESREQASIARWHRGSLASLRDLTDRQAAELSSAHVEHKAFAERLAELRQALAEHRELAANLEDRVGDSERGVREFEDHVHRLEATTSHTSQLANMLWVSKPWQSYLMFKRLVRRLHPRLHDSLATRLEASMPPTREPASSAPLSRGDTPGRDDAPGRSRVLVIDHRLPAADQDSGSLRMVNLLKILNDDFNFSVTFVPVDLDADQTREQQVAYAQQLEQLGVEVLLPPALPSIKHHLEQHGNRYACVILSRAPCAVRFIDDVRTLCPDAKIVFDTVDLHYVRETRQAQHQSDHAVRVVAEQTKEQELGTARKADATLVVSSVERDILARDAPGLNVHVVSNIHHVFGTETPFEERNGLLFIGGFEHTPNIDAVTWLVRDIFPTVRATLPSVHLYVVGSKPTPEVRALQSDAITVTGYVPDVEPFFHRCKLSVAPLRFGAGVKGKVNQSLAHGLPCVVTSVAAEGMALQHRVDALIADSAEEFAAHVIELYRDKALWEAVSAGGLQNVRGYFSFEAARRALDEMFESIDYEVAALDTAA